MTKITFFKKKGLYYGFRAEGHADFAARGEDIVCAAISILTQTLCFYALEAGVLEEYILVDQEDGALAISFLEKCDYERIQEGFRYLKVGIDLLAAQYPEYVQFGDRSF